MRHLEKRRVTEYRKNSQTYVFGAVQTLKLIQLLSIFIFHELISSTSNDNWDKIYYLVHFINISCYVCWFGWMLD
jgi:hypothetical protein